MNYIKYPEFEGWFKEGLFVRRQFGGDNWSVGRQMWFITKLRNAYFMNSGVGCIWNIGKIGGMNDAPYIEKCGWIKAKIKNGFRHIKNPDMRLPMMAMLLTSLRPLPKAHDISDECNIAWEQFKFEFAKGLYELYKARVGTDV